MDTATQTVPVAPLTLSGAITEAPKDRALAYDVIGATAPVAGGGVIGRGYSVRIAAQDDSHRVKAPYFVFQHGKAQQAITVQAFAAALYHGVIPRADVLALFAAADAATARVAVPAEDPPAADPPAEDPPKTGK